jgi:hypothetical protein
LRWNLDQIRAAGRGVGGTFDVLPNDQLVAVQKGEGEDELTQVDVILNFFEELRRKMKAGRKG